MITRQTVDQAIDDAVEAALPELGSIDRDARLTGDLGLDSVQIMGLVMEIEDRLDLSIPVELLAEIHTINELSSRLVELTEGRQS